MEALRVRLDGTASELARARVEQRDAETSLRDVRERLERLRDGVAEEDDLDVRGLPRLLFGLQLVGVLGLLAAATLAFVFCAAYFPEPSISMRGLENAAWIVRNREGLTGLAGAVAIFLSCAPWVVLPWSSAVGLRRRRRWGWLLGVVSSVLWLPTPALPLGLFLLVRLFSGRTRRVFFP